MTDEVSVTQADRDAADEFLSGFQLGVCGVRRLENILAHHREAHTAPLAKPVLTLVQLVREYLPPDGISKDEFINRVLGVLDNDEMAELVGELEGRE